MDAGQRSVVALLLGTLSISTLHALIPSHWLAFAIVGRTERWTVGRTLAVTVAAGVGHILITVILGVLVATAGKALVRSVPEAAEHTIAAVVLIALGIWFALPSLRGHGGCHHHHEHDYLPQTEADAEDPLAATERSRRGRTAIGALVAGMTLSPCLDLLSVYIPAFQYSWRVVVGISLVMAVTTLGLMALLVWLAMHGMRRLNLAWLDRNEGLAVGGTLVALGLLLLFVKMG